MNQPCRWLSLLTATATWRYERCLCCTVDNANHSCGKKKERNRHDGVSGERTGAWCCLGLVYSNNRTTGGRVLGVPWLCWCSLLTWSHDYKQKETKKDWSNSVWTILFSWRHVVSSFFVGMNLILAPNVCCVVFLRKEMDKRKEFYLDDFEVEKNRRELTGMEFNFLNRWEKFEKSFPFYRMDVNGFMKLINDAQKLTWP